MSSENLHAPREHLSPETLNLHFAIVSLMEELDAIRYLDPHVGALVLGQTCGPVTSARTGSITSFI